MARSTSSWGSVIETNPWHKDLIKRKQAVGSGLVKIIVRQTAERLHVQFFTARQPIKTLCHKMATAVFLEQLAEGHGDSGGGGHFVDK